MASAQHPIFARFYTWLSRRAEATVIARHRDEQLEGSRGRVAEVGAGNGMNFAHYPSTVERVIAIEPEPYLRSRAVEGARRARLPIMVIGGIAERLPLADGSVDAVVASLVLCSVRDQGAALSEMRRILVPGGELRFYEHVMADTPVHARFQRGVDVLWPRFTAGCHTARDTPSAIRAAGFEIAEMKRFDLGPRVGNPVAPHALGRARRT